MFYSKVMDKWRLICRSRSEVNYIWHTFSCSVSSVPDMKKIHEELQMPQIRQGTATCGGDGGLNKKEGFRKLNQTLTVQSVSTRCRSHIVSIIPADVPATKALGHLQVWCWLRFELLLELRTPHGGQKWVILSVWFNFRKPSFTVKFLYKRLNQSRVPQPVFEILRIQNFTSYEPDHWPRYLKVGNIIEPLLSSYMY